MNFPVDLNEWEVEKIERGIEIKDVNGKALFEGDKIIVDYFNSSKPQNFEFELCFKDGAYGFSTEYGLTRLTSKFIKEHKVEVIR